MSPTFLPPKNCIHIAARIDVRYIHKGRGHEVPIANVSRYVLCMRLQRYYKKLTYARKSQNKNDLSSRTGHFKVKKFIPIMV